jgi:hypothetical protein
MAGRIRCIKPELIATQRFAGLSDAAKVLYYGLLALVDDDGNCPAGSAFLNGQIFYARPRSAVSIGKLVAELEAAGWVSRYEVDRAQYVAMVGWSEKGSITYQKIDRYQGARFPAPSRPDSSSAFDDGSPISDLRSPKAIERGGAEVSLDCLEQKRAEAVVLLDRLDKAINTRFARDEPSVIITMVALRRFDAQRLRKVIDAKVHEWGNVEKMLPQLTPRVLFGPRCGEYIAASTAQGARS